MNNLEKKFYNLSELVPLVNLKYRQLQKIVKNISEKYKDRKELIYKESNRWYISYSIIKEFKRRRNLIDYKLFITIASKNQFEIDYWRYIVIQLNKQLHRIDSKTRIKYVIEKNSSNIYHLHFITNFGKIRKLSRLIKLNYITNDSNDMNVKILHIYQVKGIHKYFRKQNKPVLLK